VGIAESWIARVRCQPRVTPLPAAMRGRPHKPGQGRPRVPTARVPGRAEYTLTLLPAFWSHADGGDNSGEQEKMYLGISQFGFCFPNPEVEGERTNRGSQGTWSSQPKLNDLPKFRSVKRRKDNENAKRIPRRRLLSMIVIVWVGMLLGRQDVEHADDGCTDSATAGTCGFALDGWLTIPTMEHCSVSVLFSP
jgi:hypothetical protein